MTVTYNSSDTIEETLSSIEALHPGDAIIVDNGSSDATLDIIGKHSLRLHRGTNIGFGAGCNLGVSLLKDNVDFYLFLNPDAHIDASELTKLVAYLDEHPQVAIVGPRMFREGIEIPSCGKTSTLGTEILPLLIGPLRKLAPRRVTPAGDFVTGPVGYVEGACFVVRKSAFDGFDERYFLFFEELDLANRLRARGLEVHVVGEAKAEHHRGGSRATVADGARSHFWASTYEYLLEWHGKRQARLWAVIAKTMWLIRRLTGSIDAATYTLWREAISKRRAKTVLVAHPSPDLYGSDRSLLRSLDALTQGGYSLTVTMPHSGPLFDYIEQRHLPIHVMRIPVLRRRWLQPTGLVILPFAMVGSVLRQVAYLRQLRPSIVYVNTITLPTWILAGKLARIPVILHCREAESHVPGPMQTFLRTTLRPAQVIIANSRSTGEWVSETAALKPKTTVVYNCAQAPADLELKPANNEVFTFVIVGRLLPRKGHDIAIAALRLLHDRGVHARMRLVGEIFPGYEQLRKDLQEQASGLDVDFAGFNADPWPDYSAADAVIVPSRVEPFGLVAIEGMLAGRAVIASGVQGLAEIITDGETGLLVPPEDAAALADAMQRLIEDAPLRQRLATAGQLHAATEFSVERYGQRLVEVFDGATR